MAKNPANSDTDAVSVFSHLIEAQLRADVRRREGALRAYLVVKVRDALWAEFIRQADVERFAPWVDPDNDTIDGRVDMHAAAVVAVAVMADFVRRAQSGELAAVDEAIRIHTLELFRDGSGNGECAPFPSSNPVCGWAGHASEHAQHVADVLAKLD